MATQAPAGEADADGRRVPVERLRASGDVRAVFASRQAVVSPVAVVHIRGREQAGPARATVVAGRKVGSAVERNRVKRRLRALLTAVPLRAGTDYVVVGRRPALTASAADLRRQVAAQLREAETR